MNKLHKLLTILFLISFSSSLFANCEQLYPHNTKVKTQYKELCNQMYVSVYDTENRRVIFTSELLQPTGHVIQRKDSFHKDSRVKNSPDSNDYVKSGYDRGHMVPAGDSTSATQMYQSFLMTNITPQNPNLNRGRWKELEEAIRYTIKKSGKPTHVITGAVYQDNKKINNIPVPTHYYKIVYYGDATDVFYTSNNFDDAIRQTTVDWVYKHTNINFMR